MHGIINIHVSHSVVINRPCENVWDFTQDFPFRTTWDHSMLNCILISEEVPRKAIIKAKSGMTATLVYKVFDRPHKTSLRMTDIHSPLVIDGGGSWSYAKQSDDTTLWTQSNSIILKKSLTTSLLKPFLEWNLKKNILLPCRKRKTY